MLHSNPGPSRSDTSDDEETSGKENPLTEEMVTLTRHTLEGIFRVCIHDAEIKKAIVSVLVSKDVTEETLYQEIALLLSQDEVEFTKQQVHDISNILLRVYLPGGVSDREDALLPSQDRVNSDVKQSVDREKTLDEGRFAGTKMKLNAQPERSELSNEQEEEKETRKKSEVEPTSDDSSEAASTVESIDEYKPTSEHLIKAAFTAARKGDICRFEVFVNYSSDLLYEIDIIRRSLLEVAAENFHSEIVKCILCKHFETCKDKRDSSKFSDFICSIKCRNDLWSHDLGEELSRIFRSKDCNESDRLKFDEIFNRYVKEKEQEKEIHIFDTDQCGRLSYYADIIKYSSEKQFKYALEMHLDPDRKVFSLENGNGCNLVTLTAALGTVDKWKVVERFYSKISGTPQWTASLDDSSSIGSPIQAAVIADNLDMFNHFLDIYDGFVINKQYGSLKNNILHTILLLDRDVEHKEDLLKCLFSKCGSHKQLIKSLRQDNVYGRCPFDLILEKGCSVIFTDLMRLIKSSGKGTIRDSLIANDCCLMKSAVAFGDEESIRMVLKLQKIYNKGEKNRMDLLNYNIKYDDDGRFIYSGLYQVACKYKNEKTGRFIMKELKSRGDASLLKDSSTV